MNDSSAIAPYDRINNDTASERESKILSKSSIAETNTELDHFEDTPAYVALRDVLETS